MTLRLPPGCVIALLGARPDDRQALAGTLAQRLAQMGVAVTRVDDPTTDQPSDCSAAAVVEQAAALSTRITQAGAQGVVVATDTALGLLASVPGTTLVEAAEQPAVAAALAQHRRYAITLLMALHAAPAASQPALAAHDARLRRWLGEARLPFSVIHGSGAQRSARAWAALLSVGQPTEGVEASPGFPATDRQAWSWSCEKCSDPTCEHQLFTRLMAARGGAVG